MTPKRTAWHVTLHRRPSAEYPGTRQTLDGRPVETLEIPAADLTCPFAVSFEEASAALERLPRMFVEPDGSFVWVADETTRSWQLDGMLYDRDGRLLYVELKGDAPPAELARFLDCCRSVPDDCVVRFARQAYAVGIAEWWRWCEG